MAGEEREKREEKKKRKERRRGRGDLLHTYNIEIRLVVFTNFRSSTLI